MSNEFVTRLTNLAINLEVQELANVVLENPKFDIWSGSSKPHQHHYGFMKLAEHTCEVVELALQNNSYFTTIGKGVDPKKLFLAALFHDVGKIWDYEPVNETYVDWHSVDHRHLIHHISRSGLIWCEAAKKIGWDQKDIDEVWHCILSHHGMKEWGSPVQPYSRMAWLLHLSDGLSARIDDCLKRMPFSMEPLLK